MVFYCGFHLAHLIKNLFFGALSFFETYGFLWGNKWGFFIRWHEEAFPFLPSEVIDTMNKAFLLSSALLLGVTFSPLHAADPVVAVVDGQKITYRDVMADKETLPEQFKALPDEKLFPLLQNKVVDTILIEKAASASKISENPEVKEAIKQATAQFIQQAFLADKIKGVITDEAIKKKYDEFAKNFTGQQEIQVRHILLKDKTTAMAAIKALKNGTDFNKLAKEKSLDSTAKSGGDLGFVLPGELPKELDDVVASLKPGAFSEEPVKSDFGWHILKVEGKRDAKVPAFDEVKGELRTLMTEEALGTILQDLRTKSKVELFDAKGNPIKDVKPAAAPAPAAADAKAAPAADKKEDAPKK